MPFPNHITPRPFTRSNIELLNPDQDGVYGIYRQGLWIYVGSGDIRTELLRYRRGQNPCIIQNQPTHYVAMVTSDYIQREKELIRELDPVCNRKVG